MKQPWGTKLPTKFFSLSTGESALVRFGDDGYEPVINRFGVERWRLTIIRDGSEQTWEAPRYIVNQLNKLHEDGGLDGEFQVSRVDGDGPQYHVSRGG